MHAVQFGTVDDEILAGIASILWASAWASHVEECGCQSFSGCEITEVMPTIPSEATDLAYQLASLVVDKHGMTLAAMYTKALEEDAIDGISAPAKLNTPTRFGECIAFEAMGDGVSWADDHAVEALSKYVHVETYDLQQHAEDACGCMDLVVQVRSSNEYTDDEGRCYSEPGPGRVNIVYLDVYAANYTQAEAWANRNQSADGSSWETARDLDGLVYNIVYDRSSLIEDLRAEGYKLDLSEYMPDDSN